MRGCLLFKRRADIAAATRRLRVVRADRVPHGHRFFPVYALFGCLDSAVWRQQGMGGLHSDFPRHVEIIRGRKSLTRISRATTPRGLYLDRCLGD